MVFVHSRKETVKTAEMLVQRAQEKQMLDLFVPDEHPRFELSKRELASSRNREMKDLFNKGFGCVCFFHSSLLIRSKVLTLALALKFSIHHAGMLRSDRTMSERLFEQGLTKVLCCTATLAWGVNLPGSSSG